MVENISPHTGLCINGCLKDGLRPSLNHVRPTASPPTTPKALVIPRRLISDNVYYPIVEDNQRGKRVIKDLSGEGSHPW